MRKIPRLTRDWRIRTIVPVLVVNVLAFAGLYALMYHWAISNLVQTRRISAEILFDEFQFNFADAHRAPTVAARLERYGRAHDLESVRITEGAGLTQSPLQWQLEKEDRVTFTRGIDNEPACHGCHDPNVPRLAVMQLGFDMRAPVSEARSRVRGRFTVAGFAWVGVLGILFWSARRVIGRPLAEIERTIGAPRGDSNDLEELAHRVDRKLWELIDARRQREEDIARHMARAEQLAALGQVAAGLTHEIKNPLAGVIAALEVLRAENVENGELHEQMLNELRRVTGTVDGLLRLAKPQPPQRARADLVRIVREVTSLLAARARRQGVTLDVDVPELVPALQLDSGLMVQLLINLVTNALQATDRGGRVTVQLAPFPRNDGVVLAVSDSGKGIAPEQLPHVFDPFFTTKEEGTGLGLPICRQIAEQHGGTIEVQSAIGEGTRVIVLLPQTEEVRDGATAVG